MTRITTIRQTPRQTNTGVYDSSHRSEMLKARLRNHDTHVSHILTSVDAVSTKIADLLDQIRLTSRGGSSE